MVKPKKDADDGKHHITIIGQPQDMDYYIATVAAGVSYKNRSNNSGGLYYRTALLHLIIM